MRDAAKFEAANKFRQLEKLEKTTSPQLTQNTEK